jgi:hypothetical protein
MYSKSKQRIKLRKAVKVKEIQEQNKLFARQELIDRCVKEISTIVYC